LLICHVGIMTGEASPLAQRLMDVGPCKRLAFVAGKTDILPRRFEKLGIGGVMYFMTAEAFPFLYRFMHRFF
jgi:hypothetical protein